MKIKEKRGWSDILVFLVILGVTLVYGMVNIRLPGVYFDSAITDYLALLVVRPELDNTQTTMLHVGLPLLGSVYHGSASMFLQMVILLFFKANVVTLRVPYLFYYAISVFIMYKIICKLGNRKFAIWGSIIVSGMIYVVTLSRTQYDIMLIGNIFLLLSIYTLISNFDIFCGNRYKDAEKYSFFIGLFMGLAFYDYFCFLFFYPPVLLALFILQKNNRLWILLSNMTGLVAGSTLYFIGYADSLLTNLFGNTPITLGVLVIFIIVYSIVIGIPATFFITKKEKGKFLSKYYLVCAIICFVLIAIGVLLFAPLFYEKFMANGLSIMGNSSIKERLTAFFHYYYDMVTDKRSENMINGFYTSVLPITLMCLSLITQIVFYAVWLAKKIEIKNITIIHILNCMFFCYYICSLPFASRMQPQHFVSFIFIMLLVCISQLSILFSLSHNRINKVMEIIMLIAFFILNIHDHIAFQHLLIKQEGVAAYSVENNQLAMTSLANQKSGIKEVYLFAEPGCIPSFIYLTDNAVKTDILYNIDGTFSESKMDIVEKYLNENDQINIVTRRNVTQIETIIMKDYPSLSYTIKSFDDKREDHLFDNIVIRKK